MPRVLVTFAIGLLSLGVSISAPATDTVPITVDYTTSSTAHAPDLVHGRGGLTLARGKGSATITSAPIEAPLTFTAVAAHWRASTKDPQALHLELSTSADGREWTPFFSVPIDPHMVPAAQRPDGTANPYYGDIVGGLYHRAGDDGRYARVRWTLRRQGGEAPTLQRLTLTFIDAREPAPGAPVDGTSSAPRGGGYPKPPVNGRAAWGARPPNCTYSYCNVTHIAVHHTAGVGEYSCTGFSECASDVRAIQAFHMDVNGWCDLGYNFLASADGQLFEGRGGGDDVRGAHDGHNCGSMAISNMGFYHTPHDHFWTEAQFDAVAELATWKADQRGIDPEGMGFYEGFGGLMDNVYGHRDVSATACPGDEIYPRLSALRSRMLENLSGGGGALIFDNPDAQFLIGAWSTGTASADKYGADYYFASTGSGAYCVWRVTPPSAGDYLIDFWWPEGSNRSPTARLLVKQTEPLQWFTVNQQVNGGRWNSLGQFSLTTAPLLLGVSNVAPSGDVVMCDAVRLSPVP